MKILFKFLDSSHSDIMFSISLSVVFFNYFLCSIDWLSESIDVNVFVDKHVVYLFDLLLELILQLRMFLLQLLKRVSGLGFEAIELSLSY